MIRRILARLFAPAARRDLWSGHYAHFRDAYTEGGAVPYATLAQGADYIADRLDPDGAASGMRDAEALDSKHRGLLSALELARADHRGAFHVVDFGGGLGLHHRALARRLALRAEDRWTIVELPAVCAAGRARLAQDNLAFVDSLHGVPASPAPTVVLASGVLNALEDPHAVLRQFAALAPWVILGSLPLLDAAAHRVAVNTTHRPPFPLWFFSESRLLDELAGLGLEVRLRWTIPETRWCLDGADSPPAAGLALRRRNLREN